MRLHSSYQGVSHLMVRDNQLFLIGKYLVLLLVACDYYLYTLLQICLGGEFPSVPDSSQSRFIDNISQVCSGSSRGCLGNLAEVYIIRNLDFSAVYLQNFFSSL